MSATDSPSGGRPSVLRSKRRDPPIKQIPGIAKNSTRRKQEMATTQAVQEKELVHYRVEGGIAVLEMNDPPANTYTYEMMQQLDTCILKARMDESAHVLMLTGRGEKFFSAGASIPMLTTADPQFKYYFCLHANETLCRLEQTPKLDRGLERDRKSTRLNSSHGYISYAVFCLKKKKKN